jgi:hypothetical protein
MNPARCLHATQIFQHLRLQQLNFSARALPSYPITDSFEGLKSSRQVRLAEFDGVCSAGKGHGAVVSDAGGKDGAAAGHV